METQTEAAHFMERMLEPLAASLNSEAAQNIVNLRIDPEIAKGVASWPNGQRGGAHSRGA